MPISTDTPVRDGRIDPQRPAPALELRLLSERLIFRDLAEFRQAMRHRYVLAGCAGLTIPAIVLLFALDSGAIPIDLHVPSVVVGLVTAQALLILYITLSTWLLRHVFRGARVLRVWLTPGLVLGAAGLLGVLHVVDPIIQTSHDLTNLNAQILPFTCVMYLEVAATLIFRGPLRRALQKMRGGQPITIDEGGVAQPAAVAERAAPAVAPVAAAARRETALAPDDPAEARQLRQAGMKGIPVGDILRLEASGNYVTVVTLRGRQLVPGPFAAAVAQMPAELGRQVQRSHWVARRAVAGVHRKGRDLWLHLTCGAQVPVSATLRSDVQSWLGPQGATTLARKGRDSRSAMPPSARNRSVHDLQETGR